MLAIFFLFFLFLIMLATIIYEFSLVWGIFTARAPFVPIPKEVLPEIVRALKIKAGDVIYDLGCGDGRVLAACYQSEPRANYTGIEKNFLAWTLAKKRFWFLGNPPNIKIFRKNFFQADLSAATRVFTYLFPKPMNELLPKFQKELRPGTRVVSCDFIFKEKESVEIIDLHRSKNQLARRLYVYEF